MTRSADYADSNAPGCLGVLAFVFGITLAVMVIARVIG